jgi:guanylate kinase
MGRLVVLSGPSCVGKGPLFAALRKLYPAVANRLKKFVLYDSRPPRPGEMDGVDFHFRTRETIEGLRSKESFTVFEVRDDLQAMDERELERLLATSDAFFDGNPFIGSGLMDFVAKHEIECLSVFLSPLTRQEITELKLPDRNVRLADFVADVMRRKLLRRTTRQKGILSLTDLENIEIRAKSAYEEMKQAWRFDYVIPNHDGEDSENWDAFYYPIGDARETLLAFAAILDGRSTSRAEKWPPDLVS